MIRHTARISAKPRVCTSCMGRIHTGDQYLSVVASPDHGDLVNNHWWRLDECAECATRYGRGHHLTRWAQVQRNQPQEAS